MGATGWMGKTRMGVGLFHINIFKVYPSKKVNKEMSTHTHTHTHTRFYSCEQWSCVPLPCSHLHSPPASLRGRSWNLSVLTLMLTVPDGGGEHGRGFAGFSVPAFSPLLFPSAFPAFLLFSLLMELISSGWTQVLPLPSSLENPCEESGPLPHLWLTWWWERQISSAKLPTSFPLGYLLTLLSKLEGYGEVFRHCH